MTRETSGRFCRLVAFAVVVALSELGGSDGAAASPIGPVERLPGGISVMLPDSKLTVEVFSDRVVRIRRLPNGSADPATSFAVIARPSVVKFRLDRSGKAVVLATAMLQVSLDKETGLITFNDNAGKVYLTEGPHGGVKFSPASVGPAGLLHVHQAFTNPPSYNGSPEEAFFGLGQHASGLMNLRGSSVHLQQINGDVALPLVLSSKGYGLLWDNTSVTDVSVAAPGSGGLTFDSEAGRAADYYFIAGPKPDGIIASYRALTGAAPMFPRWAWGFWQCKERYATQDELLDAARHYRSLGVPLDAVIQDWQYWSAGQWGSHHLDPKRYPNPKQMMDDLHAMHVHAIISVWPRFDPGTDTGDELDRAGALYPFVFSNVYPAGKGRWYDAFNARGRSVYWRQISERLGVLGWDGYWLDASEAELDGAWGAMRGLQTAAGSGTEVYNAYPLLHTTGVYEGQRHDFPNKRALILTRSAWAGQQRNGAITWSGDIHGDWETFRRQIPAGLNFVASGVPYWNTDIGGFFGGDPSEPNYRELFVRWFQFGAFNPMFRVHGTGAAKEYWRFDAGAQGALLAAIQLRYRLLPYIYSTAWQVTSSGYTMMRPLMMDFGGDPLALGVRDQFMFGSALLVNPVVEPGAQSRNVYLPGPQTWYDFWSGERHPGGTTITAPAPLAHLPIFVRAGAILPLGPNVQYADEAPNAPLELRIYRGADGSFGLYDDAGDGYGYERGQRATISVHWDDTEGTLRFGVREGAYPGMPSKRVFNVVWVGADGSSAPHRVIYDGHAVTVTAPKAPPH